jgi:hypothetical protein
MVIVQIALGIDYKDLLDIFSITDEKLEKVELVLVNLLDRYPNINVEVYNLLKGMKFETF